MIAAPKTSSRPFHHPQPESALSCGKVSLETLAKKYGTPLYVYSADQIIERLTLFQQAFASRDHLVCYAVKANSSLAILKLLADRGAGFDIVSGGELERVLAAAPQAAERVVFSGVGKTAAGNRSRTYCRHSSIQCGERSRARIAGHAGPQAEES